MKIAPFLLLLAIPLPAFAEEPPDYIAFVQQAERFAVAANSGGSCQRLGYTTDQSGLTLKIQKMIDNAELAGMSGGSADMLLSGAIDAEGKRQDARMRAVDKTNSAAVEQFLDYWERRCAMLSNDPDYAPYFHR
jgi:hypothetical protein